MPSLTPGRLLVRTGSATFESHHITAAQVEISLVAGSNSQQCIGLDVVTGTVADFFSEKGRESNNVARVTVMSVSDCE